MSYFKNDAVLVNEYEYDFAVDGGATGVKTLSAKPNKAPIPVGAVIVAHQVLVQAGLTGSGASAKIGNTVSDVKYLANTAVGSLTTGTVSGGTTPDFVAAANETDVFITIGGGALTAGKLKVLVHFVNPTA